MKAKRLYRCTICNRVSDKSIETNLAETVKGHFHADPKFPDQSYICDPCDTEIDILKSEYHLNDDPIWNFPF